MQRTLRTQLLFQNSHPIVQEDLERLRQMKSRNYVEFNLDWTSEPEETTPRWLKKHWAMMQELKASIGWKHLENILSFFLQISWLQLLYPEGTSSEAETLDRKPCSGSFTTSPACLGHLQYSWDLWQQVHQHKPEHTSNDIRTWGCGALYNSKRSLLVNAAQKVCDRPGVQTTCFHTACFEKKMKPEVTACFGPEHSQESKNSYVNHSPYMSWNWLISPMPILGLELSVICVGQLNSNIKV